MNDLNPRLEDLIKLELHKSVVEKFVQNPEQVRGIARKNNLKTRIRYNNSKWGKGGLVWVDEWDKLLDGPAEDLIKICLEDSDHARDMRQMGPFLGVLTETERLAAIQQAHQIYQNLLKSSHG